MDSDLMLGAGIIYLIGVVLALLFTIVWIILPFAIFGTKPLLRELIREVRLLRMQVAQQLAHDRVSVPGIRSDQRP